MNEDRDSINWFFVLEYAVGLFIGLLFLILPWHIAREVNPYTSSQFMQDIESFVNSNAGYIALIAIVLLLPIIIDFFISLCIKRKNFWNGAVSLFLGQITTISLMLSMK